MKSLVFALLAAVSLLAGPRRLAIAPSIVTEVIRQYDQDSTREQGYCLYGTSNDRRVVVLGIWVPDSMSRSQDDVVLETPCPDSLNGAVPYLGFMHTHHRIVVANSEIPFQMRKPGEFGLNCSHYVELPSGDHSFIPTNDYVGFIHDDRAQISIIYCGNRLVWLDKRSTVDSSNSHLLEQTLYRR